ncbi:winged helix-turn-helix domain-containing protein [Halogeometricum borinquense]|uniref:winged helix-turn-helix domain-containing protein n=1 Tax=Halogeometricum borinquense TaxID=60847 RepID=UPI001F4C7E90|nr:winged helix-turn-helix domain-containing protein [Halogeometricum borinquense]
MCVDPEISAIAGVIDDQCSRCILVQAHEQYMSVSELADRCNVSESTIYRRLDPLREHGLISERKRPEADGHHFTEFRTNLDRLSIQITADGFDIEIQRRKPMAERLTDLVEKL